MRQSASLYCLSNPYMPGLVKIGFTRRSVHARMSELSFGGWGTSATGVPGAFVLVKAWEVDSERVEAIERQVHEALRAHRVKAYRGRRAREFFHLQPEEAVQRVQMILGEEVPSPHRPIRMRRRSDAPPPPARPVLPDPYSGWPPKPQPQRQGSALGPYLLLGFMLLVWWVLSPH